MTGHPSLSHNPPKGPVTLYSVLCSYNKITTTTTTSRRLLTCHSRPSFSHYPCRCTQATRTTWTVGAAWWRTAALGRWWCSANQRRAPGSDAGRPARCGNAARLCSSKALRQTPAAPICSCRTLRGNTGQSDDLYLPSSFYWANQIACTSRAHSTGPIRSLVLPEPILLGQSDVLHVPSLFYWANNMACTLRAHSTGPIRRLVLAELILLGQSDVLYLPSSFYWANNMACFESRARHE